MDIIDVTGKPCPIPVIMAKKALAQVETTSVTLAVDNFVAVQNLEKMARGMGYHHDYHKENEERFIVRLAKEAQVDTIPVGQNETATQTDTSIQGATILISSDKMGQGSDELGKTLLKGFIFSLTELEITPKVVIFLNGGAHLTCKGSGVLGDLRSLQERGTNILTCGACLNYYNLADSLAVGEIENMYTIATLLADGGTVITL